MKRNAFTLTELLVACQPKPRRRPTRQRFTLIELLMVIAIISVLAAMLLPALESARFMAQRVSCLSDRRQNHLSLQYFANDHDGLVPHPILGRDIVHSSSERDRWPNQSSFDTDGWQGEGHYAPEGMDGERFFSTCAQRHTGVLRLANNLYDPGDALGHLGVMAAFGYIEASSLVDCPAFDHPNGYSDQVLDFDGPEAGLQRGAKKDWEQMWEQLTNANGTFPKDSYEERHWRHMKASIVHYFASGGRYSRFVDSRLDDYAMNWNSSNLYSPIMFSCANQIHHQNREEYVPDLMINEWGTGESWRKCTSHEYKGLNAVFYDGSARWIPHSEVAADGILGSTPDYLSNNSDHMHQSGSPPSNMQHWARKKATVAAP